MTMITTKTIYAITTPDGVYIYKGKNSLEALRKVPGILKYLVPEVKMKKLSFREAEELLASKDENQENRNHVAIDQWDSISQQVALCDLCARKSKCCFYEKGSRCCKEARSNFEGRLV